MSRPHTPLHPLAAHRVFPVVGSHQIHFARGHTAALGVQYLQAGLAFGLSPSFGRRALGPLQAGQGPQGPKVQVGQGGQALHQAREGLKVQIHQPGHPADLLRGGGGIGPALLQGLILGLQVTLQAAAQPGPALGRGRPAQAAQEGLQALQVLPGPFQTAKLGLAHVLRLQIPLDDVQISPHRRRAQNVPVPGRDVAQVVQALGQGHLGHLAGPLHQEDLVFQPGRHRRAVGIVCHFFPLGLQVFVAK